MSPLRRLLIALPWAAALSGPAAAAPALAQTSGTVPSAAASPASGPVEKQPPFETRTTSLAARGLFVGDELSPLARQKLTELIVEALGLNIQVALVVPTGPWRLDDSASDERHLTPARLASVKRYLSERGVDPKKIFVESRIDDSVGEPRLDVQIGGRQAVD